MAIGRKKDSIALLYSGGADSTYSACILARNFSVVHLFTYKRLGFFGGNLVYAHLEKMRERFPQTKFIHHFIDYEKFYHNLTYENYFKNALHHGFLVLATCGFCKVAMHWRNLIYCLDNGIKYAADGATVDSREYVEQNPRILMPEIKKMYEHFGITLLNPVYQADLSTEKALYQLGITEKEKIKRTKFERQIYCSQHILYAMMLRIYLSRYSFEDIEKIMKSFFIKKINYIVKMTEEYTALRERSRLAGWIAHE